MKTAKLLPRQGSDKAACFMMLQPANRSPALSAAALRSIRVESTAAPAESSNAAGQVSSPAQAATEENSPKLCPDPKPDVPHGASDRATEYQAPISRLNNPQEPLPSGVAVSLINPVTGEPGSNDDCRERDGTMIEAKGPRYAKLLEHDAPSENVRAEWIDQATDQVQASSGRRIEGYFGRQARRIGREIFDKTRGRLTFDLLNGRKSCAVL
jgi:hypothetical protein